MELKYKFNNLWSSKVKVGGRKL